MKTDKRKYMIISAVLFVVFTAVCAVFALMPEGSVRAAAQSSVMTGGDGERTYFTEITPGDSLNINTASAKELEALPDIGTVLAQRIVDYREQNGDFQTPEDIMKVDGIGQGRFDEVRDKIRVTDGGNGEDT